MNLSQKVIAGSVALATAATAVPTTSYAHNSGYLGRTANTPYSTRSIDSIEGLAQGQNGIKLINPSTGDYLPVAASGRPDVKSIRDYLDKHGSAFIKGDPGKEYMASLADALNQANQQNDKMSTGAKVAIVVFAVAGGGFLIYKISQNGNKKVIEGGT